ncbi:MAG: flagellar FlbD family protein [Bryobacteraceae bacterium]
MIRLTRLNHSPFLLNSDLIEHVEFTPDTVISLTSGQKIVVLESPEEIVSRVIEFRRAIHAAPTSGGYPSNFPLAEHDTEPDSYGR